MQEGSTIEEKMKTYLEICVKFQPVFRHFLMEKFVEPAVWLERRLSYTRSVATNSIGKFGNIQLFFSTLMKQNYRHVNSLPHNPDF